MRDSVQNNFSTTLKENSTFFPYWMKVSFFLLSKSYINAVFLNSHNRVHTGEKRFKCKKFDFGVNCFLHVRTLKSEIAGAKFTLFSLVVQITITGPVAFLFQ